MFNDVVEELINRYNIPSLGYTIISPNLNTIQTFGDVDENSLWQVASVSKNISATAMMWMSNSKKVSIYSRINDGKSKTVKFSDNVVTKTVNIRDCMSHTTGLPRQAAREVGILGYSEKKGYETLKYYPNDGYRIVFNYNDVAYTLGFRKGAELLGYSSNQILEKFFMKAGMCNTKSDPYLYKDIVPQYNLEGRKSLVNLATGTITPAGGIATTLKDLTTYIKLHLSPPEWLPHITDMYKPVIRSGDPNGEFYGMGTAISRILGITVYFHEGLLTSGVSTIVFYDVVNHIGIGILTNNVNMIVYPLALYMYYILRGESEQSARNEMEQSIESRDTLFADLGCTPDTINCTMKTSSLDGTYISNLIGTIIIKGDYIKVGRTKPVKYCYDGSKITFVYKDIDGENNYSISTVVYENKEVVGLSSLLRCSYFFHTKM